MSIDSKGNSAQLNFTAKAFRKLRKITLKVKEISIRDIQDWLFDETYLDPSFQVETTRWTIEQKQSFIISIIQGLANHPISVCFREKSGDQLKKHYEWLNEIYAYISIDGNNRLNAIIQYLNDEFPLSFPEEGVYSEEVNFVDVYFSELPADVQRQFLKETLFVHMYEVEERNDLSTLFKRLSSGTPLNDQEVRNCYPGIVSSHIRKVTNKLKAAWGSVPEDEWSGDMSGFALNSRRTTDEFLAKWLYRLANPSDNSGISSKKLDTMYRLNSAGPASCKLHREQVQVVCDTFSHATGYNSFSFDELTKSKLANYLIAIDIAMSLDYDITSPAKFFEWFWESELVRRTTPVNPKTRAAIVTASKTKDPRTWAKQTERADKEKYSNWSTNAIDNTTKVKKRAAMIKADFINAAPSLLSSGAVTQTMPESLAA